MTLDFVSGLLLAAVVLIGGGYLASIVFAEPLKARLEASRARRGERAAKPAPGANDHLIGAAGRVVDRDEASGEIRVRIGMERWRARVSAPGAAVPPVGAEVEVKAVDGRVLEVDEKSGDPTEAPAEPGAAIKSAPSDPGTPSPTD